MKRKTYLCVGIAMLLLAIGFIIYAFNNPQVSFPWNNSITYTIYAIYAIAIIICFILALRKK